jgi:hypothetical protein
MLTADLVTETVEVRFTMFRTSMEDQAGFVGMFGDGLAHWHSVSRGLPTHWYHVSIKRRHEDRFFPYEEFLNDEPRLVQLLCSQGEDLIIEEVQVVTPRRMNQQGWRMEKLKVLSMGFDGAEVPVCILEVENGRRYTDSFESDFRPQSLTGLKELYRFSEPGGVIDRVIGL